MAADPAAALAVLHVLIASQHGYCNDRGVPAPAELFPMPAPEHTAALDALKAALREPRRERLPDTRASLTHKFEVGNHKGYATVGLYPDGRPGELFLVMNKEGSTISGLMDALSVAVSLGLQYGVPLRAFTDKFRYLRFDPNGPTPNRELFPDYAHQPLSLLDYLAAWLQARWPEYAGPPGAPPPALNGHEGGEEVRP